MANLRNPLLRLRLHVLSDLHLEFGPVDIPDTNADVVVLAGDIAVGPKGLDWIRYRFQGRPVVYVLGNHEFYRHNVPRLTRSLKREAEGSHIHLLEDSSVDFGGFRFLGCTLWTDFAVSSDPLKAMREAETSLNDYRLIRFGTMDRVLRATDTVDVHQASVAWLKSELARHDPTRTIVVTHHGPSPRSEAPGYVRSPLSPSFVSDHGRLIEQSGIPLWIHGHTHYNADYQVGATRVLTNQRGYPQEACAGFDPGMVIEVQAEPEDMSDIDTARELLGVEEKFLQPFDANDPFNDELRLEGFLCLRPDHRYGALALLRVGGKPAAQLLYATPKLHYPFGKDGVFRFPPIRRATIYEKLDGTNVLAYRYRDAEERVRLTYKLRLAPVLRNSKWGPFLDYWKELLGRYPAIARLVEANDCHISFEMYGARNAHLLAYKVDLEVAVLFGVRCTDASITPPFELQTMGVPVAPVLIELQVTEDPVTRYAALRAEMQSRNRPAEDEKLTGIEGAVWYVTEPSGRVTLWKCKPESVEAIHWATGINKAAVVATCWNALETSDVLNYEVLLPLLLEEYENGEIERFGQHINEAIAEVNREFAYRQRVWIAYAELQARGMSLRGDKAGVMRALSAQFRRDEMKRVFSALARKEGLL